METILYKALTAVKLGVVIVFLYCIVEKISFDLQSLKKKRKIQNRSVLIVFLFSVNLTLFIVNFIHFFKC